MGYQWQPDIGKFVLLVQFEGSDEKQEQTTMVQTNLYLHQRSPNLYLYPRSPNLYGSPNLYLRETAPELQLEYVPVIFAKTTLGPNGGFAGEERLVQREIGLKHIEEGTCVPPTAENRKGVWCFNADTDQFDRYVERTDAFL